MRILELELWPKIIRALSFILIAMIDQITWCQVCCYCSKIYRPRDG